MSVLGYLLGERLRQRGSTQPTDLYIPYTIIWSGYLFSISLLISQD
jgi:hypothetical protein